MEKTPIKDFYGKIIGWIFEYPNGDKIVKDFYGQIKGRYIKVQNTTVDFYGRIVGRGDISASLLYMQ